MPELPEVETIRSGLEKALCGGRIREAVQRRESLRVPFPPNLAARLSGRRIERIGRRAKYLLFTLSDSQVMALHLGMSGRVRALGAADAFAPGKHDHFSLHFEDGRGLVFNDPRRFGVLLLFADSAEMTAHTSFAALGPEPLEDSFCGRTLETALSGRSCAIKQALLDQRVIAGVGNIYASEALFGAGISPLREAGSVTGEDADKLAASIREVLERAIAAGGSSLRDYRQAGGEMGYFQHQFSVYDRAGQACPGCTCGAQAGNVETENTRIDGTRGIVRIVQGGRSTFYCPARQR